MHPKNLSIIKNLDSLLSNAETGEDRSARELALKALEVALEAADPKEIIYSKVFIEGSTLKISDLSLDLSQFDNIYVLGGGKASGAMAEALEERLGDRIRGGIINIPKGTREFYHTERIVLNEASHPVPDEKGVEGTKRMLEIAEKAGERDLVLCLISGGGSSLMPQPRGEVTLEDKRRITDALLKSGATINEINTVRKHISNFKGGWLAKRAYPATVVGLLLSDVVGDPLDVIASGPTVPDTTTFKDAITVLKKYNLWKDGPPSIKKLLEDGAKGVLEETPKKSDIAFRKVYNIVIGSNRGSCLSAKEFLESKGLKTVFLTSYMEGEAREVGTLFGAILREVSASSNPAGRPCAIIAGGETTVTVVGDGKGGRNQELALASAFKIKGLNGVVLASINTDGVDGPTDAAGAVVDGKTLDRADSLGLNPTQYLLNNDSYTFFSKLNDLIMTGPTGTNVTDITVMVAL